MLRHAARATHVRRQLTGVQLRRKHVCTCTRAPRAQGARLRACARRRAAAREHHDHLRHRPARAQGRRAHLRARPHPGPRGRRRGARRGAARPGARG